ncbi:MAG: malonate decarboxylase holo-[acyl-carrier-protein] synthase [Rhodospirillales bacterium]|nr:malonate decarboxylase holo-[acyl-carrier-protein] synthase [Rhodospirillales bacterium]
MTPHARHWLATPSIGAWEGLLAARPDLAAEPLVAGWAERRWPVIQRRRLCDDPPDGVPLGLPLPPNHGKRRLAFSLPEAALSNLMPPPRLCDCMAAAPADWRAAIDALLALDPQTRCFGGLAWQHLTGLPYLSSQSDLDLLWTAKPDLPAFLDHLRQIATTAPMRIDGEISGPGGAVQWRELAEGAQTLAAKREDEVVLLPRDAWLAGLAA